MEYITTKEENFESDIFYEDVDEQFPIRSMVDLFKKVNEYASKYSRDYTVEDQHFLTHVHTQLVYFDDDHEHLSIPVYSYIKPTMGVQFILHILLSMGHFATEVDLISHPTIQ